MDKNDNFPVETITFWRPERHLKSIINAVREFMVRKDSGGEMSAANGTESCTAVRYVE